MAAAASDALKTVLSPMSSASWRSLPMFAVGSFSAPATRLMELSNCMAAFAAYPPTATSGAVMPAVMASPTSAMARPALCMRAPIRSAATDASANLFAMADAPPIAAIFVSNDLRARSA